jgi:hypothetical protein
LLFATPKLPVTLAETSHIDQPEAEGAAAFRLLNSAAKKAGLQPATIFMAQMGQRRRSPQKPVNPRTCGKPT